MKPYQCVFWLLLFCSLIAIPALADSKEATISPGRTAEPLVCALPWTGACCNPLTGDCTITLESDCAYNWLGLDVPCTLENCPIPPLPEGACCDQATGVCTITTQTACDLPSIWLGAGVLCNAQTCQPPSPTERTSWGQIKSLYR